LPESCINSTKRLEADISAFETQSFKQLRREVYRDVVNSEQSKRNAKREELNGFSNYSQRQNPSSRRQRLGKENECNEKDSRKQANQQQTICCYNGTHSQLDRIQIPTNEWYYSAKEAELYRYDNGVWEA
jgi:hypothetical protein